MDNCAVHGFWSGHASHRLSILIGIFCLAAFSIATNDAAHGQSKPIGCTVERYAFPPTGCQRERLEASGRQRPFIDFFPSARVSARRAWEREALTKFGERFKDWKNAVCTREECVKGSVSGLKRCIFSGYSCVQNPRVIGEAVSDDPNHAGPSLTRREIRHLQRLLRRQGYRRVRVRGALRRLEVDGAWGDITRTAVALWLERAGVDDAAITDRDVYNALRRRARR
jgi:hypothetical protein